MGRARATDVAAEAEDQCVRERLDAIEAQGRQVLELIRALVGLLMPKDDSGEGPSLEQLLAQIIAQQREGLAISRATQGDLQGFARMLPDEVAEAVESRVGAARVGRS